MTGPVILYLQQAGVGGRTVEDAGTQSIAQEEYGAFIQDSWQPIRNLTINAGLRWDGIYQPDPRTAPDEVFFAPFIGHDPGRPGVPVRRNDPRRHEDVAAPARHLLGPVGRRQDGRAGDVGDLLRARSGARYRVLSLDERLGRPVALPRRRSSATSGTAPLRRTRTSSTSAIGSPDHPDVYVFDKDFRSPKTTAWSLGVDREIIPGLAGCPEIQLR